MLTSAAPRIAVDTLPPILGKMGDQGVAGMRMLRLVSVGRRTPDSNRPGSVQIGTEKLLFAEPESLAEAAIDRLRRHETP